MEKGRITSVLETMVYILIVIALVMAILFPICFTMLPAMLWVAVCLHKNRHNEPCGALAQFKSVCLIE